MKLRSLILAGMVAMLGLIAPTLASAGEPTDTRFAIELAAQADLGAGIPAMIDVATGGTTVAADGPGGGTVGMCPSATALGAVEVDPLHAVALAALDPDPDDRDNGDMPTELGQRLRS